MDRRNFETASADRYGLLKIYASYNRNHPTEAERMLWRYLKGSYLGVKFKRQHVIFDYIADFVCLEKRLIIEVDGEYHSTEEQQIKDAYRTEDLERLNFHVIRFSNTEVFTSIENVLNRIKEKINKI